MEVVEVNRLVQSVFYYDTQQTMITIFILIEVHALQCLDCSLPRASIRDCASNRINAVIAILCLHRNV